MTVRTSVLLLMALALVQIAAVGRQTRDASARRLIDFSVLDPVGNPVTNLGGEDLLLSVDGQPGAIRRLHPPGTRWNVLLLIDRALIHGETSSPFGGQNRLIDHRDDMARAFAEFLPSMARGGDRLSVVAFDDTVETLVAWQVMPALPVEPEILFENRAPQSNAHITQRFQGRIVVLPIRAENRPEDRPHS